MQGTGESANGGCASVNAASHPANGLSQVLLEIRPESEYLKGTY
jgi:hypothetical protein